MENNFNDNIDEILDDLKKAKQEVDITGNLLGEISYSLTYNEAYHCLKNAGLYKTSGKRAIVYTVLMVIAALGFLISYIVKNDINWLIFSGVSIAVIVVIWLVPAIQLKKLAKINSDGKIIKARIYRDKILINTNDEKWEISLDTKNRLKIYDDIYIFYTGEKGQIFVIPTRVLNEEIIKVIKSSSILNEKIR